IFLVLALSLLCGISQRQASFTLAVLKLIMDWLVPLANLSEEHKAALKGIPRDYRTLLKRFDLDPRLRSYTCCPSCFALYKDSLHEPETCTYRKAPDQPPCGASLFRTKFIR
ncbi:hypothetical protein BU15DRAFT_7436, partial [Melanogaster broomeanus]